MLWPSCGGWLKTRTVPRYASVPAGNFGQKLLIYIAMSLIDQLRLVMLHPAPATGWARPLA